MHNKRIHLFGCVFLLFLRPSRDLDIRGFLMSPQKPTPDLVLSCTPSLSRWTRNTLNYCPPVSWRQGEVISMGHGQQITRNSRGNRSQRWLCSSKGLDRGTAKSGRHKGFSRCCEKADRQGEAEKAEGRSQLGLKCKLPSARGAGRELDCTG